jgi:hypothetical protein
MRNAKWRRAPGGLDPGEGDGEPQDAGNGAGQAPAVVPPRLRLVRPQGRSLNHGVRERSPPAPRHEVGAPCPVPSPDS